MDKTLTIRLPGSILAQIQDRAAAQGSSAGAIARETIIRGLNFEATEARILAAIEGAQKQEKEHATAILKVLTLMQQLKK